MPNDPCKGELAATAILADGARKELPFSPAAHRKVDCFYVYPTVDLDLVPGNHEDFDDTRRQTETTLAQVGRFGEVCDVWAPLYRQVTLGTFLRDKERLERGLAIAFSDVEAAFREYLARADPSRKIVVVGHSQGGNMIVRLVKRFFDHDPAMRARLLLAMPIGADVVKDTFENVPPCTKPNETGCVVAYRSYAGGAPVEVIPQWIPPAGHESVCVNPATLDGGDGRFADAFFSANGLGRRFLRGIDGVSTPYVAFPDWYAGRCVATPNGFSYLEIADSPRPGDARAAPLPLHRTFLGFRKMGLHVLDMQIPQGDLVAMIARRAAALP